MKPFNVNNRKAGHVFKWGIAIVMLFSVLAGTTHACVANKDELNQAYAESVKRDMPLVWWRFDDKNKTDGAMVSVAVGRMKGVYRGNVKTSVAQKAIGGHAAQFDGKTGYLTIDHNKSLALNELSIELWFRTTQSVDDTFWPGSGALISKATRGPGSADWTINLASTKQGQDQGRVLAHTGPRGKPDLFLYSSEDRKLNDGQWHHVALTRAADGSAVLYVDGVPAASGNDGGGSIINERPINIGGERWHEGGKMFHGELDEVALYDRVLSAQRIAAHYKAGGGKPVSVAGVPSKPIHPPKKPLPAPLNLPTLQGEVTFARDIQPIFKKNCQECHGPTKQKSGLNLTIRAHAFAGGDSGQVIVPGKAMQSTLFRMAARLEDDRMPPKGDGLTDLELAKIQAWINGGADWPDGFDIVDDKTREAKNHWAFQPVRRPVVPAVQGRGWGRNAIDAFVLARLEAKGLKPALPADSYTLLRRASFDLIGLPPSLKDVESFVSAASEQPVVAYESLIGRLLGSPHHGERYGRHWLDVVRYGDSAGYELDSFYNHAARYRDYVIDAINADKPFDRFMQEQLAADELWPSDSKLQFATGLFTVGPFRYEGGIARGERSEYERRTDTVDTIGSAFIGMTVGCARCHSHKFDPISQRDYFGLHAIIAPTQLWDERSKKPADNSSDRAKPKMWIIQNRKTAPVIHLLRRGDLSEKADVVSPRFLMSLPGGGLLAETNAGDFRRRRARFAEWLTSEENPLTARVIANRVWAWHFGMGLVRTTNDFGTQGEVPSHPELLDYLASELIRSGWKLKALHRLIMTSATYRMASRVGGTESGGAGAKIDPQNRLLWRFPRRRLEAEAIWDNLHATAGTISLKMGGPAVVPPISKDLQGTLKNANWKTSNESEWTRRGVYIVVRRSLKFPFFDAFNVNTPSASCGRRDRTVVSPQALHLLNGPVAVTQARAFAGRLLRESAKQKGDERTLVRLAWLHAYGREPNEIEVTRTVAFIAARTEAQAKVRPQDRPAPINAPQGTLSERGAAVVELCVAILNTNEFIYVD